jgi:hypothetical protein
VPRYADPRQALSKSPLLYNYSWVVGFGVYLALSLLQLSRSPAVETSKSAAFTDAGFLGADRLQA